MKIETNATVQFKWQSESEFSGTIQIWAELKLSLKTINCCNWRDFRVRRILGLRVPMRDLLLAAAHPHLTY